MPAERTPQHLKALAWELARRLSLTSEPPYRISAYERLAEALEALPETAFEKETTLLKALAQQPGIGQSLLQTARELYNTGTTPLLETLRQEWPEELLELFKISGLGPKRIAQLWQEKRITSPEKLLEAIERGKLQGLRGWGPSLISTIRTNLQAYLSQRGQLLYYEAAEFLEALFKKLGGLSVYLAPVGAFRRSLPLFPVIELIGVLEQRPQILAQLPELEAETEFLSRHVSFPLQIHWVSQSQWGLALLTHTGPAAFAEKIKARLPEGFTAQTEEAVFKAAELPYILPAWRDWEDILELAQRGALPEPLSLTHILGTVHVHTTYSDGRGSLAEMAEAAHMMGLRYLGIADHSQRAAYANGLSPQRLLAQAQAIQALNAEYGGSFILLHGVEADILPDGKLDYEETIWRQLDYIVGSIHEKLSMTREEATGRLLKAITSGAMRVLGHWTGRLLRGRPGYPINEEAILDACAAHQVAIEFNGNPYRMEIDWQWVRYASEKGVSIVLTTDAHTPEELRYLRYALPVLQKGLLSPKLFLNYQGPDAFRQKKS